MNQQINGAVIQKQNENNAQVNDNNRFFAYENVVDKLIAMGSSIAYMSSYANSKLAKEYGITLDELDGCKRLAYKQIKANQAEAQEQTQRPSLPTTGSARSTIRRSPRPTATVICTCTI